MIQREKKHFSPFFPLKSLNVRVIPLKNVSVNKAPFIKPSLHLRNDKPLLLPAATAPAGRDSAYEKGGDASWKF